MVPFLLVENVLPKTASVKQEHPAASAVDPVTTVSSVDHLAVDLSSTPSSLCIAKVGTCLFCGCVEHPRRDCCLKLCKGESS